MKIDLMNETHEIHMEQILFDRWSRNKKTIFNFLRFSSLKKPIAVSNLLIYYLIVLPFFIY